MLGLALQPDGRSKGGERTGRKAEVPLSRAKGIGANREPGLRAPPVDKTKRIKCAEIKPGFSLPPARFPFRASSIDHLLSTHHSFSPSPFF